MKKLAITFALCFAAATALAQNHQGQGTDSNQNGVMSVPIQAMAASEVPLSAPSSSSHDSSPTGQRLSSDGGATSGSGGCETMSFDDDNNFQMSLPLQDRTLESSLVSDMMMVDMPAYTSFSPDTSVLIY